MIYITRPSPEGELLTRQLNQANLAATHLPFFAISAGQDLDKLPAQLAQLDSSAIVIVVSPQVSHILKQQAVSINFPKHINYYAVGKRSATLFRQLSQTTVHYPNCENSEGLLALLEKQPLAGRKALILCGNGGRELLAQQLCKHNMDVIRLACYHRQVIHYPATILATDISQQLIVITSIEHLMQLERYCQTAHKNHAQLIVSSERIYHRAKQLKWQKVLPIDCANNQILFKTVLTLCHNVINETKNVK